MLKRNKVEICFAKYGRNKEICHRRNKYLGKMVGIGLSDIK
jgi:hypothetical protein